MSTSRPAASLSPTLLARKGGAKPAMRQHLQPLQEFHEATARDLSDDLGWNDLGDDVDSPDPAAALTAMGGEVVSINGASAGAIGKPEVVQQQEALVQDLVQEQAPRQSALAQGRRAAFTLRVDADRHLRLRLASTVLNQSAQQVVTEALDKFLSEMPEVESLAAKVRESR